MTRLAGLRRWKLPLARALTALFAFGWLALALQPCQASAHGAPAAPAGQGTHHPMGDAGHPCPHCPPSSSDDCGAGSALDCRAVGVAVPPQDIAPPAIAVLQPAVFEFVEAACAERAVTPVPPDPGRTRPPASSLQQRYCSFLK
jgi:hypothetical protein